MAGWEAAGGGGGGALGVGAGGGEGSRGGVIARGGGAAAGAGVGLVKDEAGVEGFAGYVVSKNLGEYTSSPFPGHRPILDLA